MKKKSLFMAMVLTVVFFHQSFAGIESSKPLDSLDYEALTQAELINKRDVFSDKKIKITGTFRQGVASDFFCEIRDTGINTKDYYCFTIGTPSLVRFYLKKDHSKVGELRKIKKGTMLTIFGVFGYYGSDFNYIVVDEFSLEPSG